MMSNSISFTLADVVAMLGLITAIAAVWGVGLKIYTWAKKPNDIQNMRIDEHTRQIADINKTLQEHGEFLQHNFKKFKAIETENHIELQALLALLEHGIDGNNIDQMRQVKETLQNYLIVK